MEYLYYIQSIFLYFFQDYEVYQTNHSVLYNLQDL